MTADTSAERLQYSDAERAALDRAAEMLRIASQFVREYAPEHTIVYDDANCDGYCVSDDCEASADELLTLLACDGSPSTEERSTGTGPLVPALALNQTVGDGSKQEDDGNG